MQTHVFAFWAILLFVTDGCIYCTFLLFSEGAFFPCMLHFHLCIVCPFPGRISCILCPEKKGFNWRRMHWRKCRTILNSLVLCQTSFFHCFLFLLHFVQLHFWSFRFAFLAPPIYSRLYYIIDDMHIPRPVSSFLEKINKWCAVWTEKDSGVNAPIFGFGIHTIGTKQNNAPSSPMQFLKRSFLQSVLFISTFPFVAAALFCQLLPFFRLAFCFLVDFCFRLHPPFPSFFVLLFPIFCFDVFVLYGNALPLGVYTVFGHDLWVSYECGRYGRDPYSTIV